MHRAISGSICYLITMRAAVLGLGLGLVFGLGSCLQPGGGGECHIDDDCGGTEVCARDQLCTAASDVRPVTTTWTVKGMPADATSCGIHPDLFIRFIGSDLGDTLGFAPVPCANGLFTIDKLPNRYWQVELGIEGGLSDTKAINAQNMAVLNVVF